MRPKTILPIIKNYHNLRKEGAIDPILGFHGFYREENLIGFIYVKFRYNLPTQQLEYAECQMLIHPQYRGQGLGKLFRKKFNEKMVAPRINKPLMMVVEGTYGELSSPHPFLLKGVKGYIHLDNLASRKLVTSLGHMPVDLCYMEYMGTAEKSAQISYIYPPNKDNSYLREEIIEAIQKNDPAENSRIIEAAISRQHDLNHEKILTDKIRNIFLERPASPKDLLMQLLKSTLDVPTEYANKTPEFWFNNHVQKQLLEKAPHLLGLWEQLIENASLAGTGFFPALEIKILEDRPGYEVKDSEIHELAVKYSEAKADFLPVKQQRKIASKLFSILEKRGYGQDISKKLASLSLSEE
jgi:hypothetical protein